MSTNATCRERIFRRYRRARLKARFRNVVRIRFAPPRLKLRVETVAMLVAISMCVAGASLAKAAEPATSGEGKMDTAQPAIVRDAMDAAEWAAKWLSSNGYKGDFTIESLRISTAFSTSRLRAASPSRAGSSHTISACKCSHLAPMWVRPSAASGTGNGGAMIMTPKRKLHWLFG
jgi:hypothetical protein